MGARLLTYGGILLIFGGVIINYMSEYITTQIEKNYNNNCRTTKPKLTRTGRRFFHPFSSQVVKIARGKDPSERLE